MSEHVRMWVGGRSSMDRLTELKTIVIDLG